MITCPKCNAQMEDGVSICSNCGEALNTMRPEYSMRYIDSKGRISQRNISQVLILNDNTFQCFCHLRNDQRTFSFSNVVEIESLDTGVKTKDAKELFSQKTVESMVPLASRENNLTETPADEKKQDYFKAYMAALDNGHGSIDSFERKRLDVLKSSLGLSDDDVLSIERSMDSDPGLSNMEKMELPHLMENIIQGKASECLDKLSQIYSNHPTKKEISSIYFRALKIEDPYQCRTAAKHFSIESVLANADLDIREGNLFNAEKRIFEVKEYAIYGQDPLLTCEEAYFYCNLSVRYGNDAFIKNAKETIETVGASEDSYQTQFVDFVKKLIDVLSNRAEASSLLQLPPYWQFMATPIAQKYGLMQSNEEDSSFIEVVKPAIEIQDIKMQRDQWANQLQNEKENEEKRLKLIAAAKNMATQKTAQYANSRIEQKNNDQKILEQRIEKERVVLEEQRKKEQEQKIRKQQEQEEKRRLKEEEKIRKQEEDRIRKQQEYEELLRWEEEEKARKQREREDLLRWQQEEKQRKQQEREEKKRLAEEEKIRKQQEKIRKEQERQRIANSVKPFYVAGEYILKYQNKKGWRYHYKIKDIFVSNGLNFDFAITYEYDWDTGEERSMIQENPFGEPFLSHRSCTFEYVIEIARAETPDDKTSDALSLFKLYPGESPEEKMQRQMEEERLEKERKEQEVQKALEAIRAAGSTSFADDKIFVSYSRKDKSVVYPLVERMQKDVGARFWVDLKGIESGSKFEEVLMQALDQADIVLFMHSDASLESDWTKREVSYAENTKKKIIPIVLYGGGLKSWAQFHFGNTDFIDVNVEAQYKKLVTNLQEWLNIKTDTDVTEVHSDEP